MWTCFRVPNGTKNPFCAIELLFFNGTERIFGTVEQYELPTVLKILSVPLKWYIATVQKGFLVPLYAVGSAIKRYRKDFRYR